jgi:hypothetical protein
MSEVEEAGTTASAESLRMAHGTRARSAYDRAVAACRHAGVDQSDAELVPRSPVGRAAHALRLCAQSLDTLSVGTADPAADARCARNAAATAALAAQVAQAADGDVTLAALRAAIAASQAAAIAAGAGAAGRDLALNAAADDAEELAVVAAREAGWM